MGKVVLVAAIVMVRVVPDVPVTVGTAAFDVPSTNDWTTESDG